MAIAPSEEIGGGGAVRPSEGWGVLHLFLRALRGRSGAETILAAVRAFTGDEPNQVIAFSVLGSRADLGLMALGPDLDALDRLTKAVLEGPVEPVSSFVSLTERSEYIPTEEQERSRLEAEGASDLESRLAHWRERIDRHVDARLHPRLPRRRMIAFYPMSKRRAENANWYELAFEDRRRMMEGHGRIGMRYAGRILQLITGSTGLDDWEWGVTLLADDPAAIKEVVSEMRFDLVSARYAEFGPFWVGLVMEPEAVLERVGLT